MDCWKIELYLYTIIDKYRKDKYMSLINCPECQKEISNSAVSCPNCGHRFKAMSNEAKKILITIAIVVIISVSLFGIFKAYQYNAQQQQAVSDKNFNIDFFKKQMDNAETQYNKTLNKDDLQAYTDAFDKYKNALIY